jgi:transcription antitermination factor NusA-like protein
MKNKSTNPPSFSQSVKDALEPAESFSVRQQQADYEKFDAIMNRSGGQAPIKGDVIGEE